jgi:hypothetical protein
MRADQYGRLRLTWEDIKSMLRYEHDIAIRAAQRDRLARRHRKEVKDR